MPVTTSTSPEIFQDFFDLGQEESKSPFITQESRIWGKNLALKGAILAALLLSLSFFLTFIPGMQPVSYILLLAVYFFSGIPALINSIEDLLSLDVNIDVLMTLAAFSSVLIGSPFEGGLLLVLFAVSGSMEEAVTEKARGALSSLHKLSPTTASLILKNGKLIDTSVKDIKIGSLILVKAGEVVPLDGEVVDGISSVSLVHLTGENFPVTKKIEDTVPAGARNLEGSLTLKVTHLSSDSTLAKIVSLVTQAQQAKPKLQRFFDKTSRLYALSIIGLTFLFASTFPFIFGIPFSGYEGSLYRSLAFLIAASPCALIIAIPIAYLSAISVCARNGILPKGGSVLDALSLCTQLALDKTGTLTTGALTLKKIEGKGDLNEALSIAYGLERGAVHPIAKAVVRYAESQEVIPSSISGFKSVPGYGLKGEYQGKHLYIGLPEEGYKYLGQDKVAALREKVLEYQEQGELVSLLTIDGSYFVFRFVDTPREGVRETLATLKENHGLESIMLTGDHEANASQVAKRLGIEHYKADLRPEDKLRLISEMAEKNHLAMVGDGVNDAPALTRATVGICMGKVGSATAIEASDIILLHDNIEKLDWLVGKSKQTVKIVQQNLTIAVMAIIIASTAALGGIIPLWLAVIMHEGGTVLVGLNALRLLRR